MTRLILGSILAGVFGASCAAWSVAPEVQGVEYGDGPEARAAQFVALCRAAGYPAIRAEVQETKTLLRCGTLDTVVYVRRVK